MSLRPSVWNLRYPSDLLDIDLEADLGIDSVKGSGSVRSIRDVFNVEGDDAFKPGGCPTPARWRCRAR
jgi:hypothetical protein